MGASRALGALICIVTLVVAILHIWYGYVQDLMDYGHVNLDLAFALPITAGVLVVCAMGFWLGWIMATTKEVSPPPPAPEKKEEEKKPEK